jgi:uncharacterized protein
MKPVFVDTSHYLALVSPEDQWHLQAIALSESLLGFRYVTEYVVIELGNALSRGAARPAFLEIVNHIHSDPATKYIAASEALLREAIELFASRPDKNWSLVDCTSFVVMKQRRLHDALTADHHFEQAGFRALLR